MKLSVDRLLGEGLALELPNAGAESDRLELARGVGVRGFYGHEPAAIHLQKISAEELDWKRVLYFLGKGGSVRAQPLTLRGVEVDALIARGELAGRARFAGHVAAREVSGKALSLDLGPSPATPTSPWAVSADALQGAAVRYAHNASDGLTANALSAQATTLTVTLGPTSSFSFAELALSKVALRQPGTGSLELSVASIEARGGRISVGGAKIAFTSVVASGIELTRGPHGVDVRAASLELHGVEVALPELTLTADRLQLPRGAAFVGGRLTIGEANAGELQLDLPQLRKATPNEAGAAKPERMGGPPALDWSFLDGLGGELDVDAHVVAKVPVIGQRTATHKFRVAIDDGIINYHSLERDMSFLEDAVLDFELEGDRLILEKDVPLIPFDNETLVFWILDVEARALAEKQLVRLRTLAHPQLPAKAVPKDKGGRADGKKAGFELVKLDLDPISAQLRLAGPARVELPGGTAIQIGAEGRPGIGELKVRGAVRHRPGQPPEPGQIAVQLNNVTGGVQQLRVGERALSVASVELDAVPEARLVLEGTAPIEARATVQGLRLHGLVLEPRPVP